MGFFTSTLFPTLTQINPNCESGYFINNKGIKACILNMFGKGGSVPSPSLFFISGLISYLYGTLLAFKDEITNSGEDYSGRMITATVLSIVLLLIVFMFNINKGCNTFIGAISSIILGIFIGIIYYIINSKIFGKENMNLPGLPVISEAAPTVAT
jgi:surface polysaccharide O-acyltransferase-like enzyme